MHLAGKLRTESASVAAAGSGCSTCSLLSIKDTATRVSFLVDTGAQVCVAPASPLDRTSSLTNSDSFFLLSANGSHIKVYRSVSRVLHLAGRKFSADILYADVDFPILGANFLRRHRLLVDVANQCLVDVRDLSRLPCQTSPPSSFSRLQPLLPGKSPFQSILDEFPQITQPTFSAAVPN